MSCHPTATGPVNLSSARTPYSDPPPGGGYTYSASADFSYPFYYDLTSELASHETGGYTLTFHDAPADGCLPDGLAAGGAFCNFATEPNGSYGAYTTHLAGVNADGTATDLGIGFDWSSNYNGTTGGIQIKKTDQPADGNGTGGVVITRVQDTTNYQYNGIVVTAINFAPNPTTVDTTPPVIMVAATPSMLWPPNGKKVVVTVSGTITDSEPGGTGVDPSTATYVVTDEYGQIQPTGNILVNPDGSYAFTILLEASRKGGDKDGRHYLIVVSAKDYAGNKGTSAAGVLVPHDQGH